MKTLNERYDYGLDLVLLSIDEGITGYRDDSLEVGSQYLLFVCLFMTHTMSQRLSNATKSSTTCPSRSYRTANFMDGRWIA
jgi:hypothetical protein